MSTTSEADPWGTWWPGDELSLFSEREAIIKDHAEREPRVTTEVLQDTERRLVALTVTLVEKGALPAFYRTPQKQAALEDKLKWHTTRLLQQAGVTLLGQMEQGGISAVGALTPELEIVGQELQGSYLDAYMEGAEGAFERQARSILKRGGVEITWDLVEPRAVEVLKDLSFQASRKLMERITGDVKGVLLKSVGEGLGTREIGNLLKDEIHDLSSKQAEGIARTEVNSASQQGQLHGDGGGPGRVRPVDSSPGHQDQAVAPGPPYSW